MKLQDMNPSISFWFWSPWKISLRLENLWYDIVRHSHVSSCLFHKSFRIMWTGLFHHLLIPKQNQTVLVSWLFFFPFMLLTARSICWLSRILPRVGKMSGARFAFFRALACSGYSSSICINFHDSCRNGSKTCIGVHTSAIEIFQYLVLFQVYSEL